MDGKGGMTGMPSGHEGGGDVGGVNGGGEDGGGDVGSGATGGGEVGDGDVGGASGGGGGLGVIGCEIAVMWWNAVTVSPSRQHRKYVPSGIEYTPCRFSSSHAESSGVIAPVAHTEFVVGSK